MGTLLHVQTGTEHPLSARHVVGRSRTCELQLDLASASALHAEITWDGRTWQLRDLGSRNGTFVAGYRLTAGQAIALEPGVQIGFGAPSLDYQFAEAAPPELLAFGPDGAVVTHDGVLCLPSIDDPEVIILCDARERWILEGPEGSRPVDDEETVVVRTSAYRIRLPGKASPTRDPHEREDDPYDAGRLELTVSHDAETVEVVFFHAGRRYELESRAHAFLLLELARARIDDLEENRLPEAEHGWMHRDDLMRELQIDDPQLLNLWVFRARRQFMPMNLHGAVIERRYTAAQLRIGIRRLSITNR